MEEPTVASARLIGRSKSLDRVPVLGMMSGARKVIHETIETDSEMEGQVCWLGEGDLSED